MRVMEFSPATVGEPVSVDEPATVGEPVSVDEPATVGEPVSVDEPTTVDESLSYGPPQWARRSFTKGFAGSDFVLQPDGTLRCPADHPLTVQERRPERNGSLRIVYGARACHCRPCPLRAQCQETATTSKPRQVSAVLWPLSSHASGSTASPTALEPLPPQLPPEPAPFPVLWGDWPRCSIRRQWVQLLRSQTVLLPSAPLPREMKQESQPPERHTRAQRAHWRLSWNERLARNARPSTAPPLAITLHGLPATFANVFGLALVAAA